MPLRCLPLPGGAGITCKPQAIAAPQPAHSGGMLHFGAA